MKVHYCFLISGVCILLASCQFQNQKKGLISAADTAIINTNTRIATRLLQKQPDSALLILKKNFLLAEAMNYVDGMGDACEFSGLAYFYKFMYDSAKYYHNQAYRYYEQSGNKSKMSLVLFSLSYDYSVTNEMNKSLECARQSRALAEESHNYQRLYDCIEVLVYIHNQLHDTLAVDSLMKELVVAAEKTGDKKTIANSYSGLGNYYLRQAYMNLAMEAYYKALKLAEESNDSVEIANAMGSVGHANLYLQDYNKAIDYYLKQEKILRSQNNLYELSITYTNLGESHNALKNYRQGLTYHLKALDLRKKMNFQLAISNSLHNVGYSYYLMKDSIDLSVKYILEALGIDKEVDNYNGFAKNYMLLGEIYILKNDRERGISYLEKSMALARQYNNPDVLQETSGLLSRLYAENKDYQGAFKNMMLYNTINDSLVNGKNVKRITQLEMQHQFDKKASAAEMGYLKEKLEYETTLKRNRIVLLFSFILASVIIVFGLFVYKSYLRSRKADKEKEALLKEIHHRVKNNLMVISSLLSLQSGSINDDKTRSAVRESQNRVKSMALIHQLLYQSNRLTAINFPGYLEQLLSSLHSTYSKPGSDIKYRIEAEDIRIDIDTAIPLGLITNELATNAYKYAFPHGTSGVIEVSFNRNSDNSCVLRISDNGTGFPEKFDPYHSVTLGLKLVMILTRQIKARLDFQNNCGSEFRIVFSNHL